MEYHNSSRQICTAGLSTSLENKRSNKNFPQFFSPSDSEFHDLCGGVGTETHTSTVFQGK